MSRSERIQRGLSTLGILAVAAAVLIWLSGGVVLKVFGARLSVRDPSRALVAAVALFAVRVAMGVTRGRRDAQLTLSSLQPTRGLAVSLAADASTCAPALARANGNRQLGRTLLGIVRFATQRTSAGIERHRIIVLGVMMGWFLIVFLVRAHAKTFWHDEVYTVLTAQLPIATLWRANLDGVDFSPPLNTLLTHLVQAISGSGLIAMRLPPILGFLAACVLLYLTVARRTNAIIGGLAALVLCSTPARDYAVEARGYGLALGFFALALYAWTEAAAGRRSTLHWIVMALALTAGVWTHYYAVLAFLPVVIGETVRQKRLHRFQYAPWAALACSALGVLPLWKLIAVAEAHRGTFWARPGQLTVGGAYAFVLKDLLSHTIVVAVLGLLAVGELMRRARTGHSTRRLAPHDAAACLGCLAIPAAGFLIGQSMDVFTARYLVFATVGVAFAAPLLLWWILPDHGLGDALGVLALALPLGVSTFQTIRQPPVAYSQLAEHPILAGWLKGTTDPIAVTGGVDYLGLWYSIPEQAQSRALYLADPESELQAEGTDAVDQGYLALARWTRVPAVPVQQFTRAHRHFWLYSNRADWVETRLVGLGASVTERAREDIGTGTLYEVSLPER